MSIFRNFSRGYSRKILKILFLGFTERIIVLHERISKEMFGKTLVYNLILRLISNDRLDTRLDG